MKALTFLLVLALMILGSSLKIGDIDEKKKDLINYYLLLSGEYLFFRVLDLSLDIYKHLFLFYLLF